MVDAKEEYNFPFSYYRNSQKEKEILYFAENFQRQFRYLYPQRPIPPLHLENECKVRKLICTSLCPLKVTKTTQLREWKDCVAFFVDYLKYKVLDFPAECPKQLYSIDSILKRRNGNSLDLCMAACTFLLSSEYDAYVVQGYATRDMTEKNEVRKMHPPIILPSKFRRFQSSLNADDSVEPPIQKSKYYVDFFTTREFWMEGKVADVLENEEKQLDIREERKDALLGKRVHFWILIRLDEMDSSQFFFIEASTGETVEINNPKYLGIEFVWNDKNFWSNSQKFDKSCEGITFEFDDCNNWEPFLPKTEDNTQIQMPETWVRDIEITPTDVENRFPPEGKHIRYRTAKVDKYNPKSMKDGLVFRATYYDTYECTDALKSHSFYTERKDGLEYCVIDIKTKIVKECFAHIREDALKEHEYHLEDDSSQIMKFYSYLRKDGLSQRQWTKTTITDTYSDRPDYLNMREVIYLRDVVDENLLQKQDNEVESDKSEAKIKPEHLVDKVKSIPENSVDWAITPSVFDNLDPTLENVDFNDWKFEDFLSSIDPSERYATSDSETEDSEIKGSDIKNAQKVEIFEQEQTSSETEPSQNADEKHDSLEDFDLEASTSAIESEEEIDGIETLKVESRVEEELQIYDDINFDELSDEELEVDYQIHLSKVWKEYCSLQDTNLFYMEQEFQKRKDMQKERIIHLKKKIIRKRRQNMRFLQRKEKGKLSVRFHKRKSDEKPEDTQGQQTNALISELKLKDNTDISDVLDLKEFHDITDMEQYYIDRANEEMIKKESMKLLNEHLKVFFKNGKRICGKHIQSIKHTYLRDPSCPLENSIKNTWFLLQTNTYRIDFHQPPKKCSCRTLIFTKPECDSIDFSFSDSLCRQIIPVYEAKRISLPRLYSYLAALLRKESFIFKEHLQFENEMAQLLAKRKEEIEMTSSFKQRANWQTVAKDVMIGKK